MAQKGYSSTKSVTIAKNIPREAVAEFSESSDKFTGINIVVQPVREYTSGNLASHILGYASQISSEEYESRKIHIVKTILSEKQELNLCLKSI